MKSFALLLSAFAFFASSAFAGPPVSTRWTCRPNAENRKTGEWVEVGATERENPRLIVILHEAAPATASRVILDTPAIFRTLSNSPSTLRRELYSATDDGSSFIIDELTDHSHLAAIVILDEYRRIDYDECDENSTIVLP